MSKKADEEKIVAVEERRQEEKKLKKPFHFEEFLQLLKTGKYEHWQSMADAVGVHSNTVQKWKKHPKAQMAIIEGITNAIEQMERSGKKDWKMWREKLQMLGVNEPPQTAVAIQQNIGLTLTDDQLKRFLGEPPSPKKTRDV